jgi:hypothetical protein
VSSADARPNRAGINKTHASLTALSRLRLPCARHSGGSTSTSRPALTLRGESERGLQRRAPELEALALAGVGAVRECDRLRTRRPVRPEGRRERGSAARAWRRGLRRTADPRASASPLNRRRLDAGAAARVRGGLAAGAGGRRRRREGRLARRPEGCAGRAGRVGCLTPRHSPLTARGSRRNEALGGRQGAVADVTPVALDVRDHGCRPRRGRRRVLRSRAAARPL